MLFSALISLSSLAQQSSGAPTTLSGCMLSLNGTFSLTTSNGIRYDLKGAMTRF
jgi:hypothetical protein